MKIFPSKTEAMTYIKKKRSCLGIECLRDRPILKKIISEVDECARAWQFFKKKLDLAVLTNNLRQISALISNVKSRNIKIAKCLDSNGATVDIRAERNKIGGFYKNKFYNKLDLKVSRSQSFKRYDFGDIFKRTLKVDDKAMGMDLIPPKVIKTKYALDPALKEIADKILRDFIRATRTGKNLAPYLTARMIFLSKILSEKTTIDKIRPIAILGNSPKSLEQSFIDSSDFEKIRNEISDWQFGFKAKSGTLKCHLKLRESLEEFEDR